MMPPYVYALFRPSSALLQEDDEGHLLALVPTTWAEHSAYQLGCVRRCPQANDGVGVGQIQAGYSVAVRPVLQQHY